MIENGPILILNITTAANDILILAENKTCYFMWIVCQVDNSHEISSLIFSENSVIFSEKIKLDNWCELSS